MANDTDNLQFVGAMNPKKQTSLDEDSKAERALILADRKRFAKYGTNNAKLAALMESGQIIPAADLVRVREDEVKRAAEFDAAVQSEQSHNRGRTARPLVADPVVFTREPVDE